jgi:hypothetical protein
MKQIRLLAILVIFSLAIFSATRTYAGDKKKVTVQAPINTGLIILLVAGAGLGVIILMNKKNKVVQE